jgi:hypothetical protein
MLTTLRSATIHKVNGVAGHRHWRGRTAAQSTSVAAMNAWRVAITPSLGALHRQQFQLHHHVRNAEPDPRIVERLRIDTAIVKVAAAPAPGDRALLQVHRRPRPGELRPLPPHQPGEQEALGRARRREVVADE